LIQIKPSWGKAAPFRRMSANLFSMHVAMLIFGGVMRNRVPEMLAAMVQIAAPLRAPSRRLVQGS
jgi:hypothetical protein